MKLLTTFFSMLIGTCFSDYILTPKRQLIEKNNLNVMEWIDFAEEHDLSVLADFDGTMDLKSTFYITSNENYFKYKSTLERFYDIEEDSRVYLNTSFTFKLGSDVKSENGVWHLSRVIQREHVNKNVNFPYSNSGQCHTNNDYIIDTYIVDTGIDVNHPQFENRAVWTANFADNIDRDCNNHGTHVAGLVGSKDYGVCVDANLHAIKVLSCDGSGSMGGVIKGIEMAYQLHREKSKKSSKTVKSIINMSLGGGKSLALNRAVEACVENDQHFYIVVAAGNEDNDACGTSPASVSTILTVMASDVSDNRAWFSNWGRCANVYAPGVDVLSTFPDGKTAVLSGTSMASPVMAGVLNHFIDMYPEKNMSDMLLYIKNSSTKNVIFNNKKYTKNYLVYLHRE